MQLTPRYLVDNKITILANDAGLITEYRPVYQRHIKVYKGIDNVLQFKVLNHDQKPKEITAYTPKFVVFDQNKQMVIERDCTVTDDGSTNTRGNCKVTVSENDLLNLDTQFLSYNVYLVDSNSEKTLTYTDTHFGSDGVIHLEDTAFPGPLKSAEVTSFTEENEIWYSESIDSQPAINGNEALHSAAVYTDSYIGNVTVQGTLENQVTGSTNWSDISTLTFTGSETTPIPTNFNGVYSYLRFKTSANPADKITKILVRN
tara:strand:+ start:365 stop:1141 length:777 start_codon:yes stop_codon:yes gene_type:complete